jgi:hypothetical protein
MGKGLPLLQHFGIGTGFVERVEGIAARDLAAEGGGSAVAEGAAEQAAVDGECGRVTAPSGAASHNNHCWSGG